MPHVRRIFLIFAAVLCGEIALGHIFSAAIVAGQDSLEASHDIEPGEPALLPAPPVGGNAQPLPSPVPKLAADSVNAPNPVRQTGLQEEISDAERIARLQRSIEADQKLVQDIQSQIDSPVSEYKKAEDEFKHLDAMLVGLDKQLQQLTLTGDLDGAGRAQAERAKLEQQWKLAKSRFELAIQERKTVQEKLVTLDRKLKQDQEALDKLTGKTPPQPMAMEPVTPPLAEKVVSPPSSVPIATMPQPQGSNSTSAQPSEDVAAQTETAPASTSVTPPTVTPAAVPIPASAATPAVGALRPTDNKSEKAISKELQKATEDAQQKEAVAVEAETAAQSVADRIDLLQKDIELERTLLVTARKKADIAEEARHRLEEEYRTRQQSGETASGLSNLLEKIADAHERFREAQGEGRQRANRLDELQSAHATLQAEQIAALREAEKKRGEADIAQRKVVHLQNPFTTHNLLQWLLDHGPRIALIIAAMSIALWLVRVIDRRIVKSIIKRGVSGKRSELENRARTLCSVFRNAADVSISGSCILMILDALGVPITALLGGAAVFGLAIAFGAQSLIKDYFYGFMILLEQQYLINDVIKVGDLAGQVERITLRMTVLRDLDGHVHFIPHGQMTSTTNMTHGWSRAVFEIGVAYKEDIDVVIGLLREVGRELRREPMFSPLILEDLTMLGVDAFQDSAVTIKFYLKTLPLKQWEVKREMLRRIKISFDRHGIEIPFPQRTVYHRQDGPLEASTVNALRRSA